MTKKTSKPAKTGKIRDKKGRFVKGTSGNLNGRPTGSGVSITTEIKKKLEEVPKGEKATYLQLLLTKILTLAVEKGDQTMIRNIWNYVDGMPLQKIEAEIEGDLIIRQTTYKKK